MQKDRKAFEKREKDRKRNIIVLMLKFMLDNGWVDSLSKFEQESTISLDNWTVADNVDLSVVYADYEQYYDVRFNTSPVVVKKRDPEEEKKGFRKLPSVKRTDAKPPEPKENNSKQAEGNKTPTTQASAKDFKPKGERKPPEGGPSLGIKGLEIEGENIDLNKGKNKKKQEEEMNDEEYFQARVLKGIPDFYANNAELRDLALSLQRDIIIQNPNVKFKDIVGLEDGKRILREAVRLPLQFPQLFTGLIEPWKGALLFGPPGTGKVLSDNSTDPPRKSSGKRVQDYFFQYFSIFRGV